MDQFHGGQGGAFAETNSPQDQKMLSSEAAWRHYFETVAVTHARYWNSANITNDARTNLKVANWYDGLGKLEWKRSLNISRRMWAKADKSKITPRLSQIITKSL